jgi:mevalonate kinase
MPAISASTPGKIILFGEHAVVYGRPAIAVPVRQVQAKAAVLAEPRAVPGTVRIQAPAINLQAFLSDLAPDHPLASAVRAVFSAFGIIRPPACTIRITSTIPIASGMGSGAAVTVSILRALSAFLGHPLPDERVSAMAFEIEKIHHGTPSGIDNTVVTFARPVYYVKDQALEILHLPLPFTIVIGDTGIPSPTALAVGDLRAAWQAQPGRYEPLFDTVGQIARQARQVLEAGKLQSLGPLMDRNHALLSAMGVSSPELDRLVEAAREAGALGAKLSGGGRGGNMIALADPGHEQEIAIAIRSAGAAGVLMTEVK